MAGVTPHGCLFAEYARCTLCPRRCGTPRGLIKGNGVCGMGTLARVAKAALHFGEEPPLCGSGGSGAVFFCGCALKCVYCQNAHISQIDPLGYGAAYTADELARIFARLIDEGAENINLVGATPYISAVSIAIRIARPTVPIVYNTSGYETEDTIDALSNIVDIWLPDYKYSDECDAGLLSRASDYPAVAMRAILRMRSISGAPEYNSRGIMTRGTIVRHLALPGRVRESMRALGELAERLPEHTPISLMGQFTPCHRSAEYGIARPLSKGEWSRLKSHRAALGLDEGWNQPPSASGTSLIPIWDKRKAECE
ncbi:MAG: radical SAM protein [Oscillospiraceae bacterium]|nr:radical SAM protein [Oscillospiraceae bacterium]